MDHILNDKKYNNIINNIMNNEEYQKIWERKHHNTTRIKHCLRVSYYSYKVAKILNLDYRETARAGLLHDFYDYQTQTTKEKITDLRKHPQVALKNAEDNFVLSDKEKNIISSHMFPVSKTIPKYMESWVVTTIDKVVAAEEFCYNYGLKLSQSVVLITLILGKTF